MEATTKKKHIADKPVYTEYLNNDKIETIIGDDMDQVDAVKYIEDEYPETAKSFKEIQKEQYELFCKKQMDYGPKNISVGTDLRTDEDGFDSYEETDFSGLADLDR